MSSMGAGNTKECITSSLKAGPNSPKDVVKVMVCNDSDIQENEMKAFDFPPSGKVLLVRQGGILYAVGNKCTHYGAPLETGVLGNGRVRCPWHGACFNIASGDIEDFPGMDSLPCYKVDVKANGEVWVTASSQQVLTSKRIKDMATPEKKNDKTFLVLGGGPASAVCAETLRQEGFKGRLVMLTKEPVLPYDRIKLSKMLDATIDKLQLRSNDFYKEHGIEVMTSTEVVGLDENSKTVLLANGNTMKFTSVFIGTGSSARRLTVPGSQLQNVFVLRDLEQAKQIFKAIGPEKNIVVLGLSFIGMEVAAYCVGKVKSVTVIGRDSVPFKPVLGDEVGARLMELFVEKGVKFVTGATIEELLPLDPEGKVVGHAKLSNGQTIPADLVLMGIGGVPNTQFLSTTNIRLTKEGAVPVNNFLQTSIPGVFAGGDIAHAPVLNTTASIGHWQLASYHGQVAARNMMGRDVSLHSVPFFWTMLFGKGIRYAGFAPKFDEVIVIGDLKELKFVAYYCVAAKVAAIATCGMDPLAAKFAELLASDRSLTKAEVKADPNAWYQ